MQPMEVATLEQRLVRLEHEFDEIKHRVLALQPRPKSWRVTVGMMPDDELSRRAELQGKQWREEANKE